MNELYSSMGFKEHPFARFSAEEEKQYLRQIFVVPKYYSTIVSDIKSRASRFIFGARGAGKSALILKILDDSTKNKFFSVLIDDYETVPLKSNERELLLLVLRELVTSFGIYLMKNKAYLKSLTKEDREILALSFNAFFVTLSKKQFEKLSESTTHTKTLNLFKRLFNWFLLKPVNIAISGCTEIVGSTVTKALGLPNVRDATVYKEYIPEIKISTESGKINPENFDIRAVKQILIDLSGIIRKTGFCNVVVLFDKIDENRALGTQLESTIKFISDITRDTALLLNDNCSFVFSMISACKIPLTMAGVRCDKMKPVDISWEDEEILNIINCRLQYFSDKSITTIWNIISEKYRKDVLFLAGQSPRQLLTLLSYIYDEQASIDCNSKELSDEAVKLGLSHYANTFDYVTYYAGANPKSLTRAIKELFKVSKVEFGSKDLVAAFKISVQAANQKIQSMLSYDLIEDITVGSHTKKYRIRDPRIVYKIAHETVAN